LIERLGAALAGGPPLVAGRDPDQAALAGAAAPAGTAVVVATSGSTGTPKLVALSAAAIRASAEASADRLGGPGHWLLALPTDHIAGLNVVMRSLLAGGPPTTMAPGRFSAQAFAAACAAMPAGRRLTSLVPTQLRRLLTGGPDGIGGLASFDAVLVGGAALAPRLRRAAEAAGVRVVATYGAAETGGGCVYDGRPLDGVSLALAPGGRVEVAGPVLASGYLGASAQGLGRERAGFFERAGRRWFASRDLGSWDDDGRLMITGRADNAITTGGETISPEPVEDLLRDLPGVADAVLVGLADAAWGELVTALVVSRAGRRPGLTELRRAVKERFTPAHAPRALGLMAALPEVAPGKPDRLAAAASAAALAAAGQLDRLDQPGGHARPGQPARRSRSAPRSQPGAPGQPARRSQPAAPGQPAAPDQPARRSQPGQTAGPHPLPSDGPVG
jgi:O-succinylbenzoic acid--CoA ligase